MSDYAYPGDELGLFEQAIHWKRYLAQQIAPFLGGRVLEVGAGIGGTTALLNDDPQRDWICLEPDAKNVQTLRSRVAAGDLSAGCVVEHGTLESSGAALTQRGGFDTLLYIDVLEHILEDGVELERAAGQLAVGGHLVVMSPAHQWLFSPFDAAVGHHRRYTRTSLCAVAPARLELVHARYLDCVGLLASAGNKLLLSKSQPTLAQIRVWDRLMVRSSKLLDPLLRYRVGKSILAVWKRR